MSALRLGMEFICTSAPSKPNYGVLLIIFHLIKIQISISVVSGFTDLVGVLHVFLKGRDPAQD